MNALLPFILDILKLVAAGTIVFFIAYSVLKAEIEKNRQMKLLDLKKSSMPTTLPLRLQAYERMVLFIERINPASLLIRSHISGASASEMQQVLTSEIRNEYQHNITQQIYVSDQAWAVINKLKEDTISLINNTAKSLPAEASAVELSKVILTHLAEMEQNPYQVALSIVKQDLHQIF